MIKPEENCCLHGIWMSVSHETLPHSAMIRLGAYSLPTLLVWKEAETSYHQHQNFLQNYHILYIAITSASAGTIAISYWLQHKDILLQLVPVVVNYQPPQAVQSSVPHKVAKLSKFCLPLMLHKASNLYLATPQYYQVQIKP